MDCDISKLEIIAEYENGEIAEDLFLKPEMFYIKIPVNENTQYIIDNCHITCQHKHYQMRPAIFSIFLYEIILLYEKAFNIKWSMIEQENYYYIPFALLFGTVYDYVHFEVEDNPDVDIKYVFVKNGDSMNQIVCQSFTDSHISVIPKYLKMIYNFEYPIINITKILINGVEVDFEIISSREIVINEQLSQVIIVKNFIEIKRAVSKINIISNTTITPEIYAYQCWQQEEK